MKKEWPNCEIRHLTSIKVCDANFNIPVTNMNMSKFANAPDTQFAVERCEAAPKQRTQETGRKQCDAHENVREPAVCRGEAHIVVVGARRDARGGAAPCVQIHISRELGICSDKRRVCLVAASFPRAATSG